MSRARSTALAPRDQPSVELSTKKQITMSAARDMVKQLAAQRLREAKKSQSDIRRELERTVGGQTTRLDESVVDQAKALMTRIALIARSRSESYSSSVSSIEKIVGKLGAIVGELQAVMLTDKAVGLFERIDEHDYRGYDYVGEKNPLMLAGKKIRDEAQQLLEGYEIVKDKPASRPAKSGRVSAEPERVSVEDLREKADNDDPFEDDDDPFEDDDEGEGVDA